MILPSCPVENKILLLLDCTVSGLDLISYSASCFQQYNQDFHPLSPPPLPSPSILPATLYGTKKLLWNRFLRCTEGCSREGTSCPSPCQKPQNDKKVLHCTLATAFVMLHNNYVIFLFSRPIHYLT